MKNTLKPSLYIESNHRLRIETNIGKSALIAAVGKVMTALFRKKATGVIGLLIAASLLASACTSAPAPSRRAEVPPNNPTTTMIAPTIAVATELPTATATVKPTETPTATPTEIPNIDGFYMNGTGEIVSIQGSKTEIPAELQGKIDHIDKLSDGRVVAVAKPENADGKAVKRVLQFDLDKKEWVAYVPRVIVIVSNPDWLDKALAAPHVGLTENKAFQLMDKNNQPLPLGVDGEFLQGGTGNTLVLVSGSVADVIWDDYCAAVLVDIPTSTGDYLRLGYAQPNTNSASFVHFIPANQVSKEELDAGPVKTGTLKKALAPQDRLIYQMLIARKSQLSGTQIGFFINITNALVTVGDKTLNQTEMQKGMIEAIKGNKDLENTTDWYYPPSGALVSTGWQQLLMQ